MGVYTGSGEFFFFKQLPYCFRPIYFYLTNNLLFKHFIKLTVSTPNIRKNCSGNHVCCVYLFGLPAVNVSEDNLKSQKFLKKVIKSFKVLFFMEMAVKNNLFDLRIEIDNLT